MICGWPRIHQCPECGDDLIHQNNRGPNESSSAFGQFMHDRSSAESAWRQFFWTDIDGTILKLKTGVLRVIEHKQVGGKISQGQKDVLPLLAKALQILASTGLVHEQSGVFVVYSSHPHDRGHVEQIQGWKSRQVWPALELTGDLWSEFLRGEVIDPGQLLLRSAA